MSIIELAYHPTHLGDLTLRRRAEPRLQNIEIYEVKLGEEYLMSSLFTESERQLAHMGLADLPGDLDVVVGGLGLGYTAASVLENPNVRSLLVIDLFQEVIDWHRGHLVPLGEILSADPRCELRQGNFFELAQTGFDGDRKFDAILLDIDHSPKHYLDEATGSFYSAEGLAGARAQLKPGGVFALWSDDPADEDFTRHLATVIGPAAAHNIEFPNPYTNKTSTNSVYVARNRG